MFYGNYSAQVDAGTLQLYVRYIGYRDNGDGFGKRAQFRYRVEEILTDAERDAGEHARCYIDSDLYSGVDANVTSQAMLGTLASFLGAAAEAYGYRMKPYGKEDDAPWFPDWLQESAYINSDELSMVDLDHSESQYS